MKHMMQKTMILLLIAVMLFTAACGAPAQQTQQPASPTPSASPAPASDEAVWINSDVSGNVTAEQEIEKKDDFNAAVNQQWMAQTELGTQAQVSTFTERSQEVMQQLLGLIKDDSQTSHEAQLVKEMYEDYLDIDTRNAKGMEPVMEEIEKIQSIETLSDLTSYMMNNHDQLAGAPVAVQIAADWKDSTHNAVYLGASGFSLSDADEYRSLSDVGQRKKDATKTMFEKLLVRVGYSEEEAAAIYERFFELETEMASACMGDVEGGQADSKEKMYNPMSVEELNEMSPDFPVTEYLADFIDAGVDRFIVAEPEWLKKMNELYTEENVEAFQAWLLYETLNTAAPLLDEECLNILQEYNAAISGAQKSEINLEELAFSLCSQALDMALGKMYVENYVTEETKEEVTEIVEQAVDVYRQRLDQNEWLGEETKAKAIEKLDNLKIRVAYPDDWSIYDYSGFEFPEDGGILDDIMVMRKESWERMLVKAKSEIDANLWMTSPQTVNAYYSPTDNSINIPAGILGGDFYGEEDSIEEQMGSLGVIIGHEITHGFDSNMGSLYDKDGNLANWWTDEDRAAFEERTDKVGEYYASIEVLPDKYINGDYTIGETVADLGGMSCMLEIAKGIEDFDYQAFFESWAKVWKVQETEQVAEYLLQTDVHAPGYLRTNVNVQQFEEFYEAYDVKEGDGMYLAPEDRLSVW